MAEPVVDDAVDVIMEEENHSSESELEDDDYDLIEENLGVKLQRKKFKRVRRISDDSEDEAERGDGREAIAQHLFEGSDNEEDYLAIDEDTRRDHYSSDSEGDYSETDDFIVDDEGQPINDNRRQGKRKRNVPDADVQKAQDIFGVGFDFKEFERPGDHDGEHDDESDYEEEPDQQRSQRKKLKKPAKSIHEIYEPYELERAGYTLNDIKIRDKDIPERLQLRTVPVEVAQDEELKEEAEWIVRQTKIQGAKENAIPSQLQLPEPAEGNWENDWDSATVVPQASRENPISLPLPESSEANWENDWDNATVVQQTSKSNQNTMALPLPEPSEANWGNDWDKASVVQQTSKSKEFLTPLPVPEPSEANWGNDWETGTVIQQTSSARKGTPASPNRVTEPIPNASAPVPENINDAEVVRKVCNVLGYFRNEKLDIPYIAFYKKGYVHPELSCDALWKIYRLDGQFCQLKRRKENLLKLFSNMKEYLTVRVADQESAKSEMDDIKMITETHLERIKEVNSADELNDIRHYFNLHYGQDVPSMKFLLKEQEGGGHTSNDLDQTSATCIKRRSGALVGAYSNSRRADFSGPFLQRIGITSEKFAENLRDKYQQHEIEQCLVSPLDTATDIIFGRSLKSQPEDVLKTVRFMMSMEIAGEPIVRKCVREEFFQRATVSCHPTKQGHHDIDESHPCFTMKYLKDKPVNSFKEDQFLKLTMAEKDGLINISLGESFDYFDEIKQYIIRDEFSKVVQEWNDLREQCLKDALNLLVPELRKELREKLLEKCYEYILDQCSSKLNKWLAVAPMKVSYPEENEVEWDTNQGIRVMAMTYDKAIDFAGVTVAVVRPDGEPDIRSYRHDEEPSDRLRLKNMLRAKCQDKDEDMDLLKDYIRDMKPHVIIIAGESREAIRLQTDVTQTINDLVKDDGFPEIRIEIVDNEAAKVYASSKRSLADLGDYTMLARQAISLGRGVQDPLLELAQLWNADEDILCLKWHPLQDQVPKERFKERLEIEFVNRTCEVGVDVNRALAYPHTASVVQFISGLGPRKASALLQKLRQTPRRMLENRDHLTKHKLMGEKVYLNCAGFIRIDVSAFEDAAESYLEILDGTRVHPACYEYARRMATDALYENNSKANSNLISAVEDIIKNPDPVKSDKLDELALEAYADSLRDEGHGEMYHTLISIREELKAGYKDSRTEYKSLESQDLFDLLTRETPVNIGKLVAATVGGVIRKKLKSKDSEECNDPVRNSVTGKWQCPSCKKSDFVELSDVWAHLDAIPGCPGPAIGVQVFLENGLYGFIPTLKLSDKPVTNPEDRVYDGQKIFCRITSINVERFSVECTSRSSDLLDTNEEWKPNKDEHYDKEREAFELAEMKEQEKKKVLQNRQVYVKRVIVHSSFRNVDFKGAEKLMESMEQGDVIVRPSSKGSDHLTVTWKVADGVSQHIDVREEGKASAFALGQTLLIGDDEFEDIDEIIARYVNPMADHAREMIAYKYYVADLDGTPKQAEEYLKRQKEKNNTKIHYIFQASKEYPGKFLLSYLPKNYAVHELVSVTPAGFRYRRTELFDTLEKLLKWFKIHYKDPLQ